jgi:ubiquinone/menaquinone biosynthesis C-methylase UbiE
MKKPQLSNFLRDVNLIYTTDKIRFYVERFKNKKENDAFKKANPTVALPPDYLMYESFKMNYNDYYEQGENSAKWISSHFGKHIDLRNKKILDWGCGPGRIIRHLPQVIGNGCEFFGTDYNKKSIDWCSKNIPDIEFNNNTLEAKLPYKDNTFDVIYGLSIFTHLSEKMHDDWYHELYRVLAKDGIILLTTQGDNYIHKLAEKEQEAYQAGKLVVRGKVKEGHRTYSAFHPKAFMEKLFKNATIVDHVETKPEGSWIPQDIWMVKK